MRRSAGSRKTTNSGRLMLKRYWVRSKGNEWPQATILGHSGASEQGGIMQIYEENPAQVFAEHDHEFHWPEPGWRLLKDDPEPSEPCTHDKGTEPNLRCECGTNTFRVCWHRADFTGGYCRIFCVGCGKGFILINDYA